MKKIFPGQNLCSGAFGGNSRPYTKQRARHRSPFLERPPPPLLRRAPMPSPPLQSNFRAALLLIRKGKCNWPPIWGLILIHFIT